MVAHLQRDKHGVAHVECASHVGRRHRDDKRLAVASRSKEAGFLPPGANAGGGAHQRVHVSGCGESQPRTTGTAVPRSPGGQSSSQAPRRACQERRRLHARGDQIRRGARNASQLGVPEAPAPDADAAARTRARVDTGSTACTPRASGDRDTRQHRGSKPAAAPGAATTVRSALPAAKPGARADAMRAGTVANTPVDMRVLLSITHGRRRLARRRRAAAVANVAPPAGGAACAADAQPGRRGSLVGRADRASRAAASARSLSFCVSRQLLRRRCDVTSLR